MNYRIIKHVNNKSRQIIRSMNTNNRVLEKINEITLANNISNETLQEEEGVSNMKSLFENLLKTQLLLKTIMIMTVTVIMMEQIVLLKNSY